MELTQEDILELGWVKTDVDNIFEIIAPPISEHDSTVAFSLQHRCDGGVYFGIRIFTISGSGNWIKIFQGYPIGKKELKILMRQLRIIT